MFRRRLQGMSRSDEGGAELKVPYLKLVVGLYEAKPNPMFTEEHLQLVRFLRYNVAVACAECGRKNKALWTMLCSFQALDMAVLVPLRSGKVHPPLTGVCQKHLMAMETQEESPTTLPKKRQPK